MRSRTLILAALAGVFVLGAISPAFADYDDWRRHEWRERAWREHAWREHEWREHAWRERHEGYYYYAPPPPVFVVPAYPRY
ncbi:MAG: hypothetical protein P4L71_07175 [Acetobacteraceae bacterium]|nr:hypothetical protein [Acetobacteraceae bacterium]